MIALLALANAQEEGLCASVQSLVEAAPDGFKSLRGAAMEGGGSRLRLIVPDVESCRLDKALFGRAEVVCVVTRASDVEEARPAYTELAAELGACFPDWVAVDASNVVDVAGFTLASESADTTVSARLADATIYSTVELKVSRGGARLVRAQVTAREQAENIREKLKK